ncbi:MAG: dehydrogenase [Deltaproteobacteria bacterium]|nr:dehydrogenase [Deltaproteobacteria bacterium]MBW2418335.1 dehydrogenase [Deltaproteobacteria bacterium]
MSLPTKDRLEIYRRLLLVRYFDEAVKEQLEEGHIPGAVHASIGHEGAIVGACTALREDDFITGTHRSHGHPIAKGADLKPLMAEIMGKETGVCRGRGGSMHLADVSVGSVGESGIVGGGIPIATGAGLSAQMRSGDRVSVCFFGDGASNQGTFHESINMAAIWKLPVVYFCENNLYAATTPARDVVSVEDIADRAAAYGIPGVVVDGQDTLAVYEATLAAVARAREGLGPSIVEAKTYRYGEHAEGLLIPVKYRAAEEVEEWKRRDPVALFRRRLLEEDRVSEEELAGIEAGAKAEIEAAVEFAVASDFPNPEDVFENVYVGSGSGSGAEAVRPAESAAGSAQEQGGEREISYFEAIFEAQREEMQRDEDVILIGEDIALYGATGLMAGFGPDRMRSAPISENGFAGMAVGAAITGLRPIVDFTIASFVYLAMDQIVNQAAKMRYMSGGQVSLPVTFRASMWHNGSNAGHHSDRPYPLFMNSPGIKVAVPGTPYDMKGILKTAIRDDDPVILFEDNDLWFRAGPVPEEEFFVPVGEAKVRREGSDVSVVAVGATSALALEAAEELAGEGISLEVIDPRWLVPLDKDTILRSVVKTGRLVVVDLANKTAGAAAEISAMVCEEAFDQLKRPILRVATPDLPIPFSPPLEHPLYPSKQKIITAVRQLL